MLVLAVSATDLHVGGGGVSYWLTCWCWPCQLLTYMLVLAVSATDLSCWCWRSQLLTYMLVLAVSATDLHVGVGEVSY